MVEMKRAAIVGDEIHFLLGRIGVATAILKFHLGKHCLSVVSLTGGLHGEPVLMPMEDGSLGLAGVNGSTLHLWSRKVDPEGVAGWVQCGVIALEKLLLPIDDRRPNHRAHVMGFAEGVGLLFVRVDDRTFMLELKSGQVKKVTTMPKHFYYALPFMSFYIPGTYVITSSELCLLIYMYIYGLFCTLKHRYCSAA